jgi:hypothetical protein
MLRLIDMDILGVAPDWLAGEFHRVSFISAGRLLLLLHLCVVGLSANLGLRVKELGSWV